MRLQRGRLHGFLGILWIAVSGLLAVFAVTPAHADEIRPIVIELTQQRDDLWQMHWKQPVAGRNFLAIEPVPPANCTTTAQPVIRQGSAAFLGSVMLQCVGPLGGQTVRVPQLAQLPGKSDALLRVEPSDGPVQSVRLTASQPEATILQQPGTWQVFQTYLIIGAEHIIMGWDHLLFVIALVLLVQRGWPVVAAATAFTAAHSITLAASVLGFAGVNQAAVEALIAMSIVFLALELLRDGQATLTRRWPAIIAFGFGLLHGFGFAGALAEIGLPQGEVPAALLAFNLGVEAGQIAVIVCVLAARSLVRRYLPMIEPQIIRASAYGIGIIASYWLIDRILGW